MRISVIVKTRSPRREVTKISDTEYRVRVTASPVDNEANEQVRQLLSEHFKVSKTMIRIAKGKTSKNKIIDIG